MKILTAIEAQTRLIDCLKEFQEVLKTSPTAGMTFTIYNVEFTEIIALYKLWKSPDKMFIVPGEYGEDKITIIYWPVPGCRITVESTPAKKLIPKINLINYN